MTFLSLKGAHIKAITTCVPPKLYDNLKEAQAFPAQDVQKVVRLAGVRTRYMADSAVCSSDLCEAAARNVLQRLDWAVESVDALIMVSQSHDYILPSTCCMLHHRLGLSTNCAALDIGLGCSGYPYGLWVAASLMQGRGITRLLLLHGETPTRFADPADCYTTMLFGDAGSATAIEMGETPASDWHFSMHTDGSGFDDLIIRGGGFRERFPNDPKHNFVQVQGGNMFNFAIKQMPKLVEDTLKGAGKTIDQVDYFIFNQTNQFILRHLIKKIGIPSEKAPITIGTFGSAGGPSVPLTITQGNLERPEHRDLTLLLIGYGGGLSWGSALLDISPDTVLDHIRLGHEGIWP